MSGIIIGETRFPLSAECSQLILALNVWLQDRRNILPLISPIPTLTTLMEDPGSNPIIGVSLMALGALLENDKGEQLPLKDSLWSEKEDSYQTLVIPSQSLQGSSIFAIPWQGEAPVDICGALVLKGEGEGWSDAQMIIASGGRFFVVDDLGSARNNKLFHDGETLQDFVMEKQFFQNNLTMNFKAGLLSAQLLALALH